MAKPTQEGNADRHSGPIYKLPESASPIDNYYVGHNLVVDGKEYTIKEYDGTTKEATAHQSTG